MESPCLDITEMPRKCAWVREQTLLLHKRAPGIRIASSLSPVEFLVSLYYGGYCRYDAGKPDGEGRDRLIMSKGHGVVSLYPILADCGFFPLEALETVATAGSFLGVIPDAGIPGVETTNGALGHGPGVATGMALALRHRKQDAQVCVVCGDGEMNEGSIWESLMFAAQHRLDNLLLVVDDNQISMLGHQRDILGRIPLADRLTAFGWQTHEVEGHDVVAVTERLRRMWRRGDGAPQALILRTVKGKGVAKLEDQELSHVLTLTPEEVDAAMAAIRQGEGIS